MAANCTVVWDSAGMRDLFLTDTGIGAALMAKAEAQAASLSAEAYGHLHSPVSKQPYVAELRRLDRTQAAVIHSTTKAVAAVGRKHGLPHW